MPKHACPVCGDPKAYPIWRGTEPPEGCPKDVAWRDGGLPAITDVTQCSHQMRRARHEVERRKVAPDCFDENGNMRPGKLAEVMTRWVQAVPGAGTTVC